MRERGGGCLTALLVALSLAVVAIGGGALYLVMTEQGPFSREAVGSGAAQPLEPKTFSEYDWDELAQVADKIAEAESDEEAQRVASQWGIEVGDVRALPLADGRSPIALRAMGDSAAGEGTWETSSLRRWLASDGADLLPEGLAERVVSVRKTSSSMSVTGDETTLVTTDDALWPFSVSEVCGQVDLFVREYGDDVRARTFYVDYTRYDQALSSEGEQYPLFAREGVSVVSDPSGMLELTYGGAPTSWWYRSAQPVPSDESGYMFYQVMENGYPTTVAPAGQESGVVVGLCL